MDHPVGELGDPLEPVLGEDDGHPEVVDEPGDGGEHLLGRSGVEGRGGLVEHEDPRVRGEHRPDRHPLLLTPGELEQRLGPQVGEPEQVERLLHPLAHHLRRHGQLLHAVGELLLHRVRHEPRQRVLSDDAHDVRELARRVVRGVATVDDHSTGERAAGEVRDEPVDGPEEARLATAGAPDHQAQLPLLDGEAHVTQHRPPGVDIGDGDLVEGDHARTGSRTAGAAGRDVRVDRTGGGATTAGNAQRRTASVGTSGSVGHASGLITGVRFSGS